MAGTVIDSDPNSNWSVSEFERIKGSAVIALFLYSTTRLVGDCWATNVPMEVSVMSGRDSGMRITLHFWFNVLIPAIMSSKQLFASMIMLSLIHI